MTNRNDSLQKGFTLVELSIVLVILGLLVGGVLSGQSLIRGAEMRSVTADIARYSTAMYSFRDKYNAVPGDMRNATEFWGTLGGDGANATCQNMEATSRATCNGDGDGFIGGTAVIYSERFRAWQHLANAGLIEGSYTGRTDSSTSGSFIVTPGKNTPPSRMRASVIRFTTFGAMTTASSDIFAGIDAGNYLEFRHSAGSPPLKPEEAWNIEMKLDDGKPGTGMIHTHKATTSATYYHGCVTSDDPGTAQYNVILNSFVCVLNIRI